MITIPFCLRFAVRVTTLLVIVSLCFIFLWNKMGWYIYQPNHFYIATLHKYSFFVFHFHSIYTYVGLLCGSGSVDKVTPQLYSCAFSVLTSLHTLSNYSLYLEGQGIYSWIITMIVDTFEMTFFCGIYIYIYIRYNVALQTWKNMCSASDVQVSHQRPRLL